MTVALIGRDAIHRVRRDDSRERASRKGAEDAEGNFGIKGGI